MKAKAGRNPVGASRLGLIFLALCLALVLTGLHTAPAGALGPAAKTRTPKPGSGNGAAPSPSAVLAAVNGVRANNGLPAFQSNGALMAAAQAHSSFQASVGSAGHGGAGGSDPKSRALAAGYGAGADVSVVENIYAGMNASPQQAVNWWQGDGLHLSTMISSKHTEAGAGAAVGSDGTVYYTLVVGVVVGGAAPGGAAPAASTASSGGAVAPGATAATGLGSGAFQQATPNPDGSILHEVQAGQTLWTIAALYKMDVNEVLTINSLYPTTVIQPGQKIIIRKAGELPSPTPDGTATPEPTRTPRPTVTSTRPATAAAALVATQGAAPAALSSVPLGNKRRGIDPLLLGIGLLVFGGGALLVAGNLLKRVG